MKHSHRKRHSAFKAKVGLTTAILLTLSGPMAAQAAEKTYDNISRWGAHEAVEGEPITVNELNGWGASATDPVHLTVGTKDTKNVTVHNYSAGEGSTTEVHGQNISFGVKEKEGNFWLSKGQITIGGEDTKTISMTYLRGGDEAKITVNGGTDSLTVGELSVGTATVQIGGANTGKVTVDSIGLWKSQQYNTGADVVIDGTQGITVNKAIAATSNSKLRLGTENNKGDVQIGSSLNWNNKPYSVSADNGSAIAITAGGKISTAGDVTAVNGNSSVTMRGASININGSVLATGSHYDNEKAPQISLTAEDSIGKRGDVHAQSLRVDNQGTIAVKGSTVTIKDEKDATRWSVESANGSTISIDSSSLSMDHGAFFEGGGTMTLKGDKKVVIGPSVNGNSRGQSVYMDGGHLYIGGKEAETALNGSIFIVSGYGTDSKDREATIDGDKITINSTIAPDQIKEWSDRNRSLAVYAKDAKLTIGHEGTNSTTINGNLGLGNNNITIYGKDAVTIHGSKGKPDDYHVPVLQTYEPVHLTIGEADTKQTSITGNLFLGAWGNEVSIAGQNVILDNAGNNLMYAYNSKDVRIGSDFNGNTSENTILKGTVTVSGLDKDGHFGIHGKNILLSDGASEQDNDTKNIERNVTDSHDAFIALHGGDNPFTIGDNDSNVSIDGRVISRSGDIDVNGSNIHLYEGANKNQYVAVTSGSSLNFGSDTTENLQLDGGFLAEGGNPTGSALKGKNIIIDAADGHNALMSLSQKVTVGDDATNYLGVNGEVFSHGGDAPISLQGKKVVVAGKGEDEALLYTTGGRLQVDGDEIFVDGTKAKYAAEVNGGSMTIGHDGTHGLIKGDLENYGSLQLSLNGADSALNGNIEDWCLEHPEGGEQGGVVLNLKDGAQWHFAGDSTVNTLNTAGGRIYFDPASTSQSLTTHSFAGEGGMLQINSTGTSHDNDRLYIIGSHTGQTALQLHSLNNGKWSDGALGSVLVSVGEEKGSFYVPDTEDRLFFHHTELGRYETSNGDKVTPRYNTDWYLKGFKTSETDENDQHTHVVRELAGLHNVNYQIWRDENDNLFKRMGDLHTQAADPPEGVWARSLGTEDERHAGSRGEFSTKTRFHEYQAGYDVLRGMSPQERHYQGVGLSYTQGRGSYFGGYSDVTGWGLGLYDTRVRSDGQYLDFALKGTHLEGELHGACSHGENPDNNGYTFGVEYGWKHPFTPNKQGWFVEPQAQLTFGWLDGADLTLANGVHYHENNIKSAVGRAGLRVGYEGQQAQFFAKADWFHEFGGSSQLYLSDDEGQLYLDEDYGDTWFAYGLGLTANLTKNSQLYADIEKSNSGTYHEKWCWDVGVRWTF